MPTPESSPEAFGRVSSAVVSLSNLKGVSQVVRGRQELLLGLLALFNRKWRVMGWGGGGA